MDTTVIIIIGAALFVMILFFILRRGQTEIKGDTEQGLAERMIRLEERIGHLSEKSGELGKVLDQKLTESTRVLQHQFGESAKIVENVTEKLTKLDATNRQVLDFSDQLRNLQDILQNPKQRGIIGEYFLDNLLKNVLPPGSYQMQYKFKDGEIVDAIVKINDRLVPIDSKFSLENYNRLAATHLESERVILEKAFVADLKMRIQETAKYIRPSEGTTEFAFMFIPSEAIYYDLLVNKVGAITEETENLIQRAANKYHVIIVSPTSFLAYLQTVLEGLRALQIEESAKEILVNVGKLKKHLLQYEAYMEKLGNQIGTVGKTYDTAVNEFKKIDKDVVTIAKGETDSAKLPEI